MSEYSLAELQKKNASIYRFSWIFFICSFLMGTVSLVLTVNSKEQAKEYSNIVGKLNTFTKSINNTGFSINKVLLNEEEISEQKRDQFKSQLTKISSDLDSMIIILNRVGGESNDSIISLTKDLKRHHVNFNGIALLIVSGSQSVGENSEIFKSQLLNHLISIENSLADLRNIGVFGFNKSFLTVVWFNFLIVVFVLILLIIGYFGVLQPLKASFKKSEEIIKGRKTEIVETNNKVNSALIQQKEVELKLKTKNAQVIKLQESLAESIKQINGLGKDKSLIYLNAATDLEGFLKVVNLQKEIIENQTNVSRNDSWRPLTSAISQLNSLVGDYFVKSRSELNHQSYSEVYLSQLISEIILSTSTNGKTVFEQMEDMPSFKTNVELLKNVLQPYFDLVSSVENMGNVKVSAMESGNYCEIKFIGLSKSFVKEIVKIENLNMVEMNFMEFKIHMAKNTIMERGGKVWIQDDVVKKGVLSVRWAL